MWCKSKQVYNPVGPESQWDFFISMYIKEVMTGINYHNKLVLRSVTCEGYAKAVNLLFKLRDYPPPVDLTSLTGCTRTIIHNLDREETIAAKRSPLDDKIHAELLNFAKKSTVNSLEAVIADIATFGKAAGVRVSEHSQTKSDTVDYHEYPSGKQVIKAITGNDAIFSDIDGKIFQIKRKSDLKRVHAVVVTWRFQKNRQNGQQIRLLVDRDHPEICPALALASMALRKHRLKHSMDLPLAVFKDTDGTVKYTTHKKVTELIRKAVKKAYPDISKSDLMKYSSHSIRVWACVALDEAGMPPDFIKKRLRWMGESYRVYLRDTNKINEKHVQALKASAAKTMELVQLLNDTGDNHYSVCGEYEDGD